MSKPDTTSIPQGRAAEVGATSSAVQPEVAIRQIWKRTLFRRWKKIGETSDILFILENQHRYAFIGNGVHAPAGQFDDFMRKVVGHGRTN